MSTVMHSDGSLVGLRNAIVRSLAIPAVEATRVVNALGEANREAYYQRYPDDRGEVPLGPIDWAAAPEPCWLDTPGGWPRVTTYLEDGLSETRYFTLHRWGYNLLYNTDGLAPPEEKGLMRFWMDMPEADLRGTGRVCPLPRKPRLAKGRPGTVVQPPRARVVEVLDHGEVVRVRVPAEVVQVFQLGPRGCIRMLLPGDYFIDREEREARRHARGGDKYQLFLSGAHPAGCALRIGGANRLEEVVRSYRESRAQLSAEAQVKP